MSLSSKIAGVRRSGTKTLSDNAEGVKDLLWGYFTVYQWCKIGSEHLQSQYSTSIQGEDTMVPSQYSPDWDTGYYAGWSVKYSRLCCNIHLPHSPRWCVTVQNVLRWNCCENCFNIQTYRYWSQDAFFDIQSGICAIPWIPGACHCQLPRTNLQTHSSWWKIPSRTSSVYSKWYLASLCLADLHWSPY